MKNSKTPVTWLVFAISMLVFLTARIRGTESIMFLVVSADKMPQSWYTLITYGFVHVEFYHILLNMGLLIMIGRWVERILGTQRYLILILLSILAGGLALVLRGSGGIGFSAAGFAILYYYYLAFPWAKELPLKLPNFLLPLALTIISVLAIVLEWLPSVGHYPHLAGAVIGVILLPVFRKSHRDLAD